MGLREDAIAAAEAASVQRVTQARAVLAARLNPANVSALPVVDKDADLVVFSDGAGVQLAVRDQVDPPKVFRVTGTPGNWTMCTPAVESLPALGLLLAAESQG